MDDVTPLNKTHRGFEIGYVFCYRLGCEHTFLGYKAAWRSSLDSNWSIGHIYVDYKGEVEQLAIECIDVNYGLHAKEVELGRRLTVSEVTDFIRAATTAPAAFEDTELE